MDVMAQVRGFLPSTAEEQQVKERLLALLRQQGDRLLLRQCLAGHITASAVIVDPDFQQMLMVYHHIYQSYSWTGGHADGESDLLAVALKEAKEETGVERVYPYTRRILSLDELPVPPHYKHGLPVAAHSHFNVAYGLIAPLDQVLQVKPDENSAVTWLPLDSWRQHCTEAHMVPVYQKILERMTALRQRKQRILAALPENLLPWYERAARQLPWRQDRDPYHVWLSEIMLQQTRVEAVKSYYQRFLAALPTVEALARAPEEQLLKLWEGLGYYNRARNLQRAAKVIVQELGGKFPETYEELRLLPGIGDYTAGAIASICFDQPTPAVDGNVLRVVSRLTELYAPIDRPATKKQIAEQLRQCYPAHRRGDFTQSLMELGATVCLPTGQPWCEVCPVRQDCMAYKTGSIGQLPVKGQHRPRRLEQRTVLLLCCGDQIALRKRPGKGLLAGLWEFPNVLGVKTPQQAVTLAAELGVQPLAVERSSQRQHVFTHIQWDMTCYTLRCNKQAEGLIWVDRHELTKEKALPTAFRMLLNGWREEERDDGR